MIKIMNIFRLRCMGNFKMKIFFASENKVGKRKECSKKSLNNFFKELMQQFQNAYAF